MSRVFMFQRLPEQKEYNPQQQSNPTDRPAEAPQPQELQSPVADRKRGKDGRFQAEEGTEPKKRRNRWGKKWVKKSSTKRVDMETQEEAKARQTNAMQVQADAIVQASPSPVSMHPSVPQRYSILTQLGVRVESVQLDDGSTQTRVYGWPWRLP